MLDRLRWFFPFALALLLPLVGAILAVLRYADGEREEALQLAAASLLGLALYGLLLA